MARAVPRPPAAASRRALLALALALGGPAAAPAGAGPAPAAASPWADELAPLLDGVREVAAPGALPGAVAVFGPDAFPVLVGGAGGAKRLPLAGAGRLGRGRVLALGHGAFLGAGAARTADTGRFLANAVQWAKGGRERGGKVGVAGTDVAPVLEAAGFAARPLPGAPDAAALEGLDVLVLGEGSPPEAVRAAVDAFVRRGGGLVTALCPWGWMQVSGAASLEENGLQRLLAPAGLGFTETTLERTGGVGYAVVGPPGAVFHAERAVDALAATEGRRGGGLPLGTAAVVAADAVRALPADEQRLRRRLRALLRARATHLVPTAQAPLRADRPLDRFLLAVAVDDLARRDPADVDAHPAAAEFPGQPPPGARATNRTVVLDLAVPGWRSTGLYATAGKPLRVTVAPTTGGARAAAGLAVRVGCHADALWHLDAWPRVPEVTLERPLGDGVTTVTSAFGGPVYLVVPPGRSGAASVAVEGAVEAPLYVLGETTPAAWAAARRAPGPWAELVTSKVGLSVPSAVVRDLDDPAALLAFWDRVLDAAADLAGRPRARARPERYVADVEISAGYMHSGYPIMTHLDAAPRMVDLARLRRDGDWGLFHELGHNHQEPAWTFEGTGEVTCNLFALYILHEVCGHTAVDGHEALVDRAAKARAHVAAGAPFDAWKADPFLALAHYVHLIEGFGWAPFRRVFAAYRALPPDALPRDDAARRDTFMVQFAREVGRDLGPFFVAWGVPTSDAARASLAGLPPWMPPGFPR